jgi:aminocarboxymuconate-semialdehyde decarboxylase
VPREDLRNLRFANWAKQLAQAKKLSTMSFFIGRGAVPVRIRRLFLYIFVGNPSETTFAAPALLLGGVFDCFPKLRVLLVHGDGCVPYQFGRMDRGQAAAPPFARGVAKSELNRYVYNLYYDTVLHDDLALRYLIYRVGANYVAVRSNFPFPLRHDDPVSTVKRQQLSQAEQRVVCWETSAALLGA